MHGPWHELGIEPTRDERTIRRAYAVRLKSTNPEDDPEGFQKLRRAYEWALNSRTAYLAADDDSSEEPVGAADARPSPPSYTPEAPVAARPPGDADAEWLRTRVAALRDELGRPEPLNGATAQRVLEEITTSPRLERIDLYHTVEAALAELLAGTIPRSDPLLKTANDRFEWHLNQAESSIHASALAVVARLSDLWFLNSLQSGSSKHAAAYGELTGPPRPFKRFMRAYVRHQLRWPEIELLNKLAAEHPSLHEELPAENVAWWRRFEERPRFSLPMMLAGFALTLIFAFFKIEIVGDGREPHPGELDQLLLIGISAGLGLPLFRMFLVDWPISLAQRRWGERPPILYELGWLPACILLVLLAPFVGAVPWLAWAVALAAWVCAWWAALARGRMPPVVLASGINFFRSRIFVALVLNLISGVWLAISARGIHTSFHPAVYVTIAGALIASAVARDLEIRGFAIMLTVRQQVAACGALAALAILVGWLLLDHGNIPAWQGPLLAAIVTCTLLRRAIPFGPEWLHPYVIFSAGFVGLFAISAFKDFTPAGQAVAKQDDLEVFYTGGLAMLTGVVLSVANTLFEIRRRN